MTQKKIAIVYDWIDKWGGVERILLTLHDLFPKADFFTSYVDFTSAKWAEKLPITTSFIQKLPDFIKKNRVLSAPLYPYAFESLNFSSYDIVISVSSSFAKGIVTPGHTTHISYILTPSRFLWINPKAYLTNRFSQKASKAFKKWDFAAAQRSDKVISISKTVEARIKKYYRRNSDVIYPPFDAAYWKNVKFEKAELDNKPQKFFLLVSRLEPYKNVGLAVETFNALGDNLVIVGKGSLERQLKQKVKKNIHFVSDITDGALASLYSKAEALIMPQEEDFGYVALEALFFGLPVISFKKGGATEILKENETGLFFEEQNVKSLNSAIDRFKKVSIQLKNSAKKHGAESIAKFDISRFEQAFTKAVYYKN